MGESLELGVDSDLQDVRQDELDAEFESPRLEIEHDASTHGIGSSQEGMGIQVDYHHCFPVYARTDHSYV